MNWLDIANAAESATGPDRDLDLAILNNLKSGKFPYKWGGDPTLKEPQRRYAIYDIPKNILPDEECSERFMLDLAQNDEKSLVLVPNFTSSLDVIMSLVTKELPGKEASILSEAMEFVSRRGWSENKYIQTLVLSICTEFAGCMSEEG